MFAREDGRSSFLWLGLLLAILAGPVLVLVAGRLGWIWALLALGGLLIAGLMFYSPYFGFLLTVAVIPMERLGRLTDDETMHTISLMRILGLLALGSFLLHAFLRKRKLRFGPAFFFYSAYCGLALLTITYTEHMLGTVRAGGAILGNLLFFFLVVNFVRTWKAAQVAIAIWLVATVLIGSYTVYDWYWGESVEVERIGDTAARFSTVMQDPSEWERLGVVKRAVGPTSSAAVYGINLAMTVPFFLFFLRRQVPGPHRLALWAGLLVVLYNILLTNTRAALLLLVVILLICAARGLVVLTPRRTFAVAALAVMAFALSPEALIQRVFDPNRYRFAEAGTFQIRTQFWKAGIEIAEQHWLTGFGVGNQKTIPRYINVDGPEQTTVHNEFLMTLIEVGIFGWLVFFGFVGLVLWYSFRAADFLRRSVAVPEMYWFLVACQTAMIGVLLYGLQVDVFHFPLKGWWLIAGISCVLYQLARQSAPEAQGMPVGSVPLS